MLHSRLAAKNMSGKISHQGQHQYSSFCGSSTSLEETVLHSKKKKKVFHSPPFFLLSAGFGPSFHLCGFWSCFLTHSTQMMPHSTTAITQSLQGSHCVTQTSPSITPTPVSISPLSTQLTELMLVGFVHVRSSTQESAKSPTLLPVTYSNSLFVNSEKSGFM